MASQPERNVKAAYESLSKNAALHVLVPRSVESDLSNLLKDGSVDDLQRIPSRRNLFFDERAIVTLILNTRSNEEDVRALLPSLELNVAAHATEAVPQGSGNAASALGKHDLSSKTIAASDCVDVVASDEHVYVVWKPELELPRPRSRLQRPAVYFTVSLSMNPQTLASTTQDNKVYLSSLEPLPANVLEPLQFASSLSDSSVYLSETRITKVAPAAGRPQGDIKPIRGASKRALPIVPALFTRVRYSGLPNAAIASLHLETSQVVSGAVSIKAAKLKSADVSIEALNPPQWPIESSSGDETVLLFRLTRSSSNPQAGQSSISVRVEAAVQQEDSPVLISLRWQTQVDLSQSYAKPTYKWSRPMSSSSIRPQARPSIHGDSKIGPLELARKTSPEDTGVTFNIWTSAIIPSRIDFKLFVQCINRSDRARRFAIVVVEPKRRSIRIQASSNPGKQDVISNTFDSPLQTQKPPDVFDINPDVRIGPVPPGASYETELKFWATTKGLLDLGIVRIVDLDTRQTVDVRELPDVVMLPSVPGGA